LNTSEIPVIVSILTDVAHEFGIMRPFLNEQTTPVGIRHHDGWHMSLTLKGRTLLEEP